MPRVKERGPAAFAWPYGYKSAAIFRVDVDASSIEYLVSKNVTGYLSLGDYGPKAGIPRLLKLFAKHGIKAAFFIPGWVAERFPERVKEIHRQGHEIGAHGYLHEALRNITDEEEREVWVKTCKILGNLIGRPVRSFASTGATTERGLRIAAELGINAQVNTHSTYHPFKERTAGTEMEMVRMPFSSILDDSAYFWGGVMDHPQFGVGFIPISSPAEALEYWMAEFESCHQVGGVFHLLIHPRASGRVSRIRAVDKLISHIKGTPGVWLASPREVADWVLEKDRRDCQI